MKPLKGPAGFNALYAIFQHITPFTAADGRAFARVPPAAGFGARSFPLRSRAFREYFFDQSYTKLGTIPASRDWNAVLRHLEAQASRDPANTRIIVGRRVDSRGDKPVPDRILVHLANHQSQLVEITAEGWEVATSDTVHFEFSRPNRTLPTPQKTDRPAAALATLRALLNLSGPDWHRTIAWLLNAFRSEGPFPILILRGPSGCGKSFAARILRALVDPCTSPLSPTPASPRELLSLARHNWVLAFDHVSTLSPRIVDSLCRLSTGLGLALSDAGDPSEPLQLWLKRPILLTVTQDFTPPPDLAARALIVDLPALTPETRRSEQDLAAAFSQHAPVMIGAICDTISTVLRTPQPAETHRTSHNDALTWAVAAASAISCTPAEMRQAFDNPPPTLPALVEAVKSLLSRTPQWTGTATDLALHLNLALDARNLSVQLKKNLLLLADEGIQFTYQRHHGGQRLINLVAQTPPPASPEPAEPSHRLDSRKLIPHKQIVEEPQSSVTVRSPRAKPVLGRAGPSACQSGRSSDQLFDPAKGAKPAFSPPAKPSKRRAPIPRPPTPQSKPVTSTPKPSPIELKLLQKKRTIPR